VLPPSIVVRVAPDEDEAPYRDSLLSSLILTVLLKLITDCTSARLRRRSSSAPFDAHSMPSMYQIYANKRGRRNS